jgi:hypothetical protein
VAEQFAHDLPEPVVLVDLVPIRAEAGAGYHRRKAGTQREGRLEQLVQAGIAASWS